MSKRASQFQISKDRGEDDDINEDELNFANQKASDEVLAKRKIIQPLFRNQNVSAPAPPANPFQGFKKPAMSTEAPSFNFSKNFSTDKKPNFGFGNTETNGASAQATPSSAATTAPTGFRFSNANSNITALPKASPQTSGASAEDLKKYKFKALNTNFLKKVSDLIESNPYGDLTVSVEKYISYAKQIANESSSQAATSSAVSTPQATQSLFNTSGSQNSAPKFSTSNESTATSNPSSKRPLFGSDSNSSAQTNTLFSSTSSLPTPPAKTEQAPSAKPAVTPFQFGSSPAISENKPTTTGFKFSSPSTLPAVGATTPTVASESKPAAKIFSFGSKPNSDAKPAPNLFQFNSKPASTTPATTTTTTSSDSKPATDLFNPATTSSAATPSSTPSLFGNSSGTSSSTSLFGNTASSNNNANTAATGKPLFGSSVTPGTSLFGNSAPSATPASSSTPADTNKPATGFSFGKPATSVTPGASLFGNSASSSVSTSSDTNKPVSGFNFGQPATTTTTTSAAAPTPFSFGSSASAKPFTFGSSAIASAPTTSTTTQSNSASTGADEDAGAEEENTEDAGPSADFTEKGPGEEHEDSLYEKKAKIYEVQDGKPVSLGVGVLRILKHRETGKSRVVVRAEGGGRVLLNTLLRSSLSYTSNSSTVSVVDVLPGGGFKRYMVRVKTADDAQQLSSTMEANKA